jgi:hypothetical protein
MLSYVENIFHFIPFSERKVLQHKNDFSVCLSVQPIKNELQSVAIFMGRNVKKFYLQEI